MAVHNPVFFFKRFLASPVAVGALFPTSLATARMMAGQIDRDARVLELGAGTGSITQGLLERLTDPRQLTAVEIDAELAAEFRRNFSQVNLVIGDAEDALCGKDTYDAIVSGIPFVVMEDAKRDRIFELIKIKLAPGGVFVAISYSLTSLALLKKKFRDVKKKISILNAPPAVIYVCRNPIV